MFPRVGRKSQYITTKNVCYNKSLDDESAGETVSKTDQKNGREYFPEFIEELNRENRLQEVLQNHFFQLQTDKYKRRYAICEVSPNERTVILYAMSASLSVRLEELALL